MFESGTNSPSVDSPWGRWLDRHARWVAPLVYAGLVISLFRSLLWSTTRVISVEFCDTRLYFIPNRTFDFGRLAAGHLPLWNPYVFGGEPALGNFQTAMLYPPNWLHLILPMVTAINCIVALHLFLAGYFAYCWGRWRGLSAGASILSGLVFMFCGPYILHIYAGHLPHLCEMVWLPITLLCVDGLDREGRGRWVMVGIAAEALQILAGNPQYVYYTGIAICCYAGLCWIKSSHRKALAWGVVLIYLGSVGIAAIQLLAGIDAAGESVRSGGTTFDFAASFSLPPLNWFTFLAPRWLGKLTDHGEVLMPFYWGLGYLWENCIFIGLCPLVLAVYGLATARGRHLRPVIGLAIISAVLAMGRFTPIYPILYRAFPGYADFRGTSKFLYVTALMLAVLAGSGFDALLHSRRGWMWLSIGTIVAGTALLVLAGGVALSGQKQNGMWAGMLYNIGHVSDPENELFTWPPPMYSNPQFIERTARQAATATRTAGWILLAVAVVLFLRRFNDHWAFVVIVFSAVELYVFAMTACVSCDASAPKIPQAWQQALSQIQPEQRVLIEDAALSQVPMLHGVSNAWGNDPNVLKRWAQFLYASQDLPAASANQYIELTHFQREMFAMIRCRFVCTTKPPWVFPVPDPYPLALLVGKDQVIPDRDMMLATIADHGFSGRQTVTLEHAPSIEPAGSAHPGGVKLIHDNLDEIELQADVTSPAILLVTQPYSRGWQASSIGPSPQDHYDVMQGDWALQAIPLAAGSHHLLLSYRPTGYVVGRWISLISLLIYIPAIFFVRWRKSSAPKVSIPVV